MNTTFWLGADGDPDNLTLAEAKRRWDAVMSPAQPFWGWIGAGAFLRKWAQPETCEILGIPRRAS